MKANTNRPISNDIHSIHNSETLRTTAQRLPSSDKSKTNETNQKATELRSRLLAMILENEQQRKGHVPASRSPR